MKLGEKFCPQRKAYLRPIIQKLPNRHRSNNCMPSFTEVKRPCQIQGEVSRDYMSATCHKEHLVNLRRRGFASTPKNLKPKPQPNEDQTNP